jgi:putative membrane protein
VLTLMWLAALLAGVVHVLIFCMESLWWMSPRIQRRFGQTPDQAATTRLFAFNQGFYNLFLAVGTFVGIGLALTGRPVAGLLLISWNCASMLAAAGVLAFSAPGMRRGALIQGTPPFLFLALAVLNGIVR